MYYRARYYAHYLNRWLSPDTIVPDLANPQSLNRYSYVNNNPVKYTDSTGHCIDGITTWVCVLVAALLGAGTGYGVYTAATVQTTPTITDPRVDSPTSVDMTAWLIDQMKANAPAAGVIRQNLDTGIGIYQIAGLKQWKALVASNGVWDFKKDILDARITENSNIILGGQELNYQAVANIYYGYMGRAAGMVSLVLEGGAGAAQFIDWYGTDPRKVGPIVDNVGRVTFGDQVFDNWAIRFGIFLYDKYGLTPDALTSDAFQAVLEEFIKDNPIPTPDK